MFRNLMIAMVVTLASTVVTASAEVINMQPGQFSVLAQKKIEAGSGVSVYGNMASVDSDIKIAADVTIYGDLFAGDDIEVSSRAAVYGDVTYEDKFKQAKSALVTGDAAKGSDWSVSLINAATFVSGDLRVTVQAGDDVTLAAGNYAGLSVGKGAALTLTAGTYNFANISLGKSVRITADTSVGNVVINSANDFNIGKDGIISRLGGGEIIVSTADDLNIGPNAVVFGQYRAYDDLRADSNAIVGGRLQASGNIWLGSGAEVGSPANGAIPEPGTFLLLACGGAIVASRRRRKNRSASSAS